MTRLAALAKPALLEIASNLKLKNRNSLKKSELYKEISKINPHSFDISLSELKDMAKRYNLSRSGTKTELLKSLVPKMIIKVTFKTYLEDFSKSDLYDIATQLHLKNKSKYNKKELYSLLIDAKLEDFNLTRDEMLNLVYKYHFEGTGNEKYDFKYLVREIMYLKALKG